MINQLALEHRLLFWQLYAEDVTGYLYWHSTFWDWITDPWKDQATVGMSDPGIYGDGSLFYPLPDGGAPSLRLELAREGLQDYELLQKAVSVLGRNAVDGYVKRLTASLTNYTSDPVLFERVRVELGNAVAAKLSGNAGNESAGKDDIEMIPIKQDFIPVGRRNRPGYKLDPRYITIHNTANPNAGAKAHSAYIKGDAAAAIPASWHFTVDDKEIYQHLPLTENGWHCGDGSNGTGNRQSIGVEICEYTDRARQDQAIERAARLTAYLLGDIYGLDITAVKQHYDWSGKNCPRVLRGRAGGWEDFLRQVQGFLGSPSGTPITGPAQATVTQAQEWARLKGAHLRFIAVAPLYWIYGDLTGIRPEVLYAQSAKETAFGRYGGAVVPSQNNWAGIKTRNATGDKQSDHETFATPEDGVRAHFNHICAYLGQDPTGTPHGRYYLVKDLAWAGTVKTVEQMGGKWAPSASYGIDIVKMLAGLLATPAPVEPEPAPAPVPADPKPVIPTGPLPAITRRVGVVVNGRATEEVGYLIDNATYIRAAYLIGLAGGEVTGHGDHIKIVTKK